MEFVSYHPQIKLEILNGSSSPIHLREAKEVCLEAFGHWGSVPKADASAPYSSPHNLLPTAYVAVHRDFGIVGFACIKKHNQPGHLPQNNGVLHTVAVKKDLRGKGIGSQLVDLVVNEARDHLLLEYLLLAAASGPRQESLVRLYSRQGFVLLAGEEVSNMGSSLAKKVSEEGISKLSAFFAKQRIDDGPSIGGRKNLWMKLRLRSRCVKALRGFAILDSDFPIPPPPSSSSDRSFDLVRSLAGEIKYEPQVGPSCGLTSLYMIIDALGGRVGDTEDLKGSDLLALAKCMKFTKDGEFFSSSNLADFCAHVLPPSCEVRKINFPDAKIFTERLPTSLFLVAFDIIGNNVGCRNGNSSHWGIVSACATSQPEEGQLYMYIQHSQSKVPILSTHAELKRSNSQLQETSSKFNGDNELSGTVIQITPSSPT